MEKSIDFTRPELLSQYGLGVQKKLSTFSEKILTKVRNKDTSEIGDLLNELLTTIQGIDVEYLANPGFMKKVWYKILKEVSLYRGSYELINDQLNFIIYKLEEAKFDLTQDLKSLEATYQENLAIYKELETLIQNADQAIMERERELDNTESFEGDPLAIHKVKDHRSTLKEFEKRVHDLKLTKTMTLQTLPQIRLIQHNNNELINKIQSSILNTIPVWRNQIILTLSLEKQKRSADIQQKIFETTNTLISKNSELLRDNTIAVASMSEEGIIQTQTLEKVNEDLINVINRVLEIYQTGREKRKETERELLHMEERLKDALAS